MIRLFALLIAFAACSQGLEPEEPTPVRRTTPAELVVSLEGTELGTIRIEPGAIGTLVTTGAREADGLRAQWAKVETQGAIHLDGESREGGKRIYSTRRIVPAAAGYVESVRDYLKGIYLEYGRGYDVTIK